jgi:hypothetical protein
MRSFLIFGTGKPVLQACVIVFLLPHAGMFEPTNYA